MASWNQLYTLNTPQKRVKLVERPFSSALCAQNNRLELCNLETPMYIYPDFGKSSRLSCNVTTIPNWLGWTMVSWLLHHDTTPLGSHIFQIWFASRFERQEICEKCGCCWRIKDYSQCLECWLRTIFRNESLEEYFARNFWCVRLAQIKQDEIEYASTWDDVHTIYNTHSVHPAFVASLPAMSFEYSSDLKLYSKIECDKLKPYLLSGFCKSTTKKQQVRKYENPYTFALRVLFATGNTVENLGAVLFKRIVFDQMVLKNACINFNETSQISGILAAQILLPTIDEDNFKEIVRETTLYLSKSKLSIDYLLCNTCFPQILDEIELRLFKGNTIFMRAWDTSFYDMIMRLDARKRLYGNSLVLCVNSAFLKALENHNSEWFLLPQCVSEAREILTSCASLCTQLYNKAKQKYATHACARTINLLHIKELIETLGIRIFNVELANAKRESRIVGCTTSVQSMTKAAPYLDCAAPTSRNLNHNCEDLYAFVYTQGVSVLPFWASERAVFNFQRYTDAIANACSTLVGLARMSDKFEPTKCGRLIRSMKESEQRPLMCIGPVDIVKVAAQTSDKNFLGKLLICTTYACIKETLKEAGTYQYTSTYLDTLNDISAAFISDSAPTVANSPDNKRTNFELNSEAQFFVKMKNFFQMIRTNARTNVLVSCGIPLFDTTPSLDTHASSFGLEPIAGLFNMHTFVAETNGTMEPNYIKRYMTTAMSGIASIATQNINYSKIDNVLSNPIALPSFTAVVDISKPVHKFQNLQLWPQMKSNLLESLELCQ